MSASKPNSVEVSVPIVSPQKVDEPKTPLADSSTKKFDEFEAAIPDKPKRGSKKSSTKASKSKVQNGTSKKGESKTNNKANGSKSTRSTGTRKSGAKSNGSSSDSKKPPKKEVKFPVNQATENYLKAFDETYKPTAGQFERCRIDCDGYLDKFFKSHKLDYKSVDEKRFPKNDSYRFNRSFRNVLTKLSKMGKLPGQHSKRLEDLYCSQVTGAYRKVYLLTEWLYLRLLMPMLEVEYETYVDEYNLLKANAKFELEEVVAKIKWNFRTIKSLVQDMRKDYKGQVLLDELLEFYMKYKYTEISTIMTHAESLCEAYTYIDKLPCESDPIFDQYRLFLAAKFQDKYGGLSVNHDK
jgi:hypothetical protein